MSLSIPSIRPRRAVLCAFIATLLLPGVMLAQIGGVQRYPGSYPPNGGGRRGGQGGRCLQQSGLSQSTMQQVRSIHEQARAEIEALCSNTSLTPQQRQERVREIEQQTRQRTEALISPAQQERLRACQSSSGRGGRGGRGGIGGGRGGFGGGHGPCGELPGAFPGQSSPNSSGQPVQPQGESSPR